MPLKQKNRNTAGGGLYIALAICVLSVICIGVYSAILNLFDPAETLPPVSQTGEEDKSPTVIVTPPKTETAPVTPTPPQADQDVDSTPTPPSYTLPVAGGVSKEFTGDRLVYSQTMNDYRRHTGVDLIAPVGTQVKAFTDGTVKEIFEDPLMGQTVILDHGDDTLSVYQNLSLSLPENIQVGAKVKEGQVIGGVGETNLIECVEAPHLHFEVHYKGVPVDPMAYFQ